MDSLKFQFLRSNTVYSTLDLAKSALASLSLSPGEPAIAYYDTDKAVMAIGTSTSNHVYFEHIDEIKALINALEAKIISGGTADYSDLTKIATELTKLEGGVAVSGSIANKIGDAKTELIGLATDTSGSTTVYGAKKYADELIALLDVQKQVDSGKFISSIEQTNGVVSVEFSSVGAGDVTFDPSTASVINTGHTNVSSALKDLDTALGNQIANNATYKINKITTGLATNVREAYQLVKTVDGTDTNLDVPIPIYKDSSLKSAELTRASVNEGEDVQDVLQLTYIDVNGDEIVVNLPLGDFLRESEFKDGLIVTNGEVKVKVDNTSDSYLTVGENGIKLSGVASAIASGVTEAKDYADDKIEALDVDAIGGTGKVLTTISQTDGKISATAIDLKATAIATEAISASESTVAISGTNLDDQLKSIGSAIKAAQTSAYNAHTSINEKTTGHITVSETVVDGKKTYTISENDIASAQLVGTSSDTSTNNTVFGKIAQEAEARKNAIEALDSTLSGSGTFVTDVTQTDGKVAVTKSNVSSDSIGFTAIEAGDDSVAVPGVNLTEAISSLAKSIKSASQTSNLSSDEKVLTTNVSETGTTISFNLSTSGATSMLSIADDGLKLNNVWDCGTF